MFVSTLTKILQLKAVIAEVKGFFTINITLFFVLGHCNSLFFSSLYLCNPNEFYRVGIKMMMAMVMMMIIIIIINRKELNYVSFKIMPQ